MPLFTTLPSFYLRPLWNLLPIFGWNKLLLICRNTFRWNRDLRDSRILKHEEVLLCDF